MKQAFTLVELLVVITIISLMSIMSVGSFLHFVEQQSLQSQLQLFESDIKYLDTKVKNKEIFDYKVELFKDREYYIVKENTANRENTIELNITNWDISFSPTSFLWTKYTFFELNTTWELLPAYTNRFEKTENGANFIIIDKKYSKEYLFENGYYTWKERGSFSSDIFQKDIEVLLKIYENNKLITSYFITWNTNIQDFSEKNNYEIQAILFTETETIPLETISLKHFSHTDKEITYAWDTITITNIFWNKQILPSITELPFEKMWKQTTIQIP